jgi:hypothetical protein
VKSVKSVKSVKMFTLSGCKELTPNPESGNTVLRRVCFFRLKVKGFPVKGFPVKGLGGCYGFVTFNKKNVLLQGSMSETTAGTTVWVVR